MYQGQYPPAYTGGYQTGAQPPQQQQGQGQQQPPLTSYPPSTYPPVYPPPMATSYPPQSYGTVDNGQNTFPPAYNTYGTSYGSGVGDEQMGGGSNTTGGGWNDDPPVKGFVGAEPFYTEQSAFIDNTPQPARFQEVQGYRDLPFYIAFVVHLIVFGAILVTSFLSNLTKSTADAELVDPVPGSEPFADMERNRVLFSHVLLTLAACAGLSMVMTIIWLSLFQRFARPLIYACLVISVVLNFIFAAYLIALGAWLWGGLWMLFAVIYAVCAMTWRSRIPFAVKMLKAVGAVVKSYPGTVRVAYASLPLLFIWIALWLVAVGLVQQYEDNLAYILTIYLIFSLYWVAQVIKNVVHVTVAGTVATWYFMHGTVGVPPNPTIKSLKRATTTSFGSICFGSLLTALLRTLRVILNSLIHDSDDNIVTTIIACMAYCIVSVIDQLLEYFNMYAYAQVAIYGKTYCQAAKDSWRLVHSHGIEAIINDNLVGNVLAIACILSSLVVAFVGGWFMFFLGESDYMYQMALVGFLVGFVVVMTGLEVIESAVVTVFVCFAEDPQALRRNNEKLYKRLTRTYNENYSAV